MTSTASKVFLDSNILVYSLDRKDPAKQERCRSLMALPRKEGTCVISTQVMQEFYVVATTKLQVRPEAARAILRTFENMEVVVVSTEAILEATELSHQAKTSFWDALIVVAASHAGCDTLYSEDLHHGQVLRGVRILNPFR